MKRGGKSESLDDARARFKHQTLLQDYLELQKETDAARDRLQMVKDKKLKLEAEVRFLRRRYNFLLKSLAQSHQDTTLPHQLTLQSKKTEIEKNSATKGGAARPPVPKFASSEKGKAHKKTKRSSVMRKIPLPIDLNQNTTNDNVLRRPGHQLDLNRTANDEDDFEASFEPERIESSNMKLSTCRRTEDAATGKRKISRQDQVALRGLKQQCCVEITALKLLHFV